MAGYGVQLGAFEMSMDRAAERAAPEVKAIFWDAIKRMTFSDARKILQGRDNEATFYFKDKTYDRLHEVFKPMVHSAMPEVGTTRKYQELDEKVRAMPLVGELSFDPMGHWRSYSSWLPRKREKSGAIPQRGSRNFSRRCLEGVKTDGTFDHIVTR